MFDIVLYNVIDMTQANAQKIKKEKYKHGIKFEKSVKKKISKKELLARIELLENKLLALSRCTDEHGANCKSDA